jgi:quercetin dioxygenase-like cupin family protein
VKARVADDKEEAMRHMVFLLGVTFAVGIAVGVVGLQVLNAQQDLIKLIPLRTTELVGLEGKEGRLYLVEFASGAATGTHLHRGHEFAYVLEGTGVFEVDGEPSRTLKPGEAMYLVPGVRHNTKNASTEAPLKLLVCSIAEPGHPPIDWNP